MVRSLGLHATPVASITMPGNPVLHTIESDKGLVSIRTFCPNAPDGAADALVAAERHDVPQLEGAGVALLLLLPYIWCVLQVGVHAAGQQAL